MSPKKRVDARHPQVLDEPARGEHLISVDIVLPRPQRQQGFHRYSPCRGASIAHSHAGHKPHYSSAAKGLIRNASSAEST